MVAQQLRLPLSLTMVTGGNFLKLLCASWREKNIYIILNAPVMSGYK